MNTVITLATCWTLIAVGVVLWGGATIRLGRDRPRELPEPCTCGGSGPLCPECRAEVG